MSGSIPTIVIDEVYDVTNYALQGAWTRRLNRPSSFTFTLPMDNSPGAVGSLVKFYIDGVLRFHGRILQIETDAAEDGGTVVYNATDPLEMWKSRPVRDVTGDFTEPTIITDHVEGPAIINAMIFNSEAPGGIPDNADGPLFLKQGFTAGGGVDLTGTPTDWPMTMADLAGLLISTGEVDLIITPIELEDSGYTCDSPLSSTPLTVYNYGQYDLYNGDYGTDRTASVILSYGMGAHNIRALRWNEDMTNMCNKLWYYLGPRKDQQHWYTNIVYTATAQFAACGMNVNSIYQQALLSRCQYGTRMEVRVYDDRNDEATLALCLFNRLWAIEAWLRAIPLTLIHVTPTRDTEIGAFDIGDLITVEAAPEVRGGFSGVQRIYEYTVSWDSDSVLALEELQVSSDAQGFST